MSSAKAYKGFKRRQMAMERDAERKPKAVEDSPTGLLKRKGGESKTKPTSDMTEVIAAYIKAIRDL